MDVNTGTIKLLRMQSLAETKHLKKLSGSKFMRSQSQNKPSDFFLKFSLFASVA